MCYDSNSLVTDCEGIAFYFEQQEGFTIYLEYSMCLSQKLFLLLQALMFQMLMKMITFTGKEQHCNVIMTVCGNVIKFE